jgi:DNA-binding HxlR family transcriptional regulator
MTSQHLHALLGTRWALPVLTSLSTKPLRFAELERALPGVSARMLSVTLRQLLAARLLGRSGDAGRIGQAGMAYALNERGRVTLSWSGRLGLEILALEAAS